MSFRDLDVDLEAQRPFSDSPEFDKVCEEASNLLLDVNNNLVTLGKLINSLKQKKSLENTTKINDKSIKSIEIITDLFKNLGILSKRITGFEDLSAAQIFTKDKVTREIKTSLDKFQDLQEQLAKITNELNDESKAALNDEVSRSGDLMGGQQQQQQELVLDEDLINNEEFAYQQNLIREREEEIQNIEQGIQELNEIFSDLGALVQEQGTMVDNIESNIFDVAQSTKTAANELTKALRYQRSSKRRTCCLFLFLVVILLIVLLGIFL